MNNENENEPIYPEKIIIDDAYWYKDLSSKESHGLNHDFFPYTRDDLYAEAIRQNAALKEFVIDVINLEGTQVMGLDAAVLAAEVELLQIDENRKYFYPNWMLTDDAMPQPSKAQVAREFIVDVHRHLPPGIILDDPKILVDAMVLTEKKWEAEEKDA